MRGIEARLEMAVLLDQQDAMGRMKGGSERLGRFDT